MLWWTKFASSPRGKERESNTQNFFFLNALRKYFSLFSFPSVFLGLLRRPRNSVYANQILLTSHVRIRRRTAWSNNHRTTRSALFPLVSDPLFALCVYSSLFCSSPLEKRINHRRSDGVSVFFKNKRRCLFSSTLINTGTRAFPGSWKKTMETPWQSNWSTGLSVRHSSRCLSSSNGASNQKCIRARLNRDPSSASDANEKHCSGQILCAWRDS